MGFLKFVKATWAFLKFEKATWAFLKFDTAKWAFPEFDMATCLVNAIAGALKPVTHNTPIS